MSKPPTDAVLTLSDLQDLRETYRAEIRSLVKDRHDPVAAYQFIRWAFNCVTCSQCGSTKPAKKDATIGEVCADCGEECSGFALHPIPHLEILRFLCKRFPPGKAKRRAVGVPREAGKTTLARGHCLWEIEHDKNVTCLFDSAVSKLSGQSLRVLKAIMESPRYKEVFGDHSGKDADPRRSGWTEDRITVADRTRIVDQPTVDIAGVDTGHTGLHPKRAYVDDLQGNQNTETDEARDKVWRHVEQLVSLAGKHGEIRGFFTIWHLDGWVSRVQRNPRIAKHYEFMVRSAVDQIEGLRSSGIPNAVRYRKARKLLGWSDERLAAEGDLYFPEHQSRETLQATLDEIGLDAFSKQYMNNPVLSGKSIPLPDDEHFFSDKWPNLQIVIAVDPATGRKWATAETGFAVVGMDRPEPGARLGNFWVLEAFSRDFSPSERENEIFRLCAKWKPRVCVIEEAGNSEVYDSLVREMLRRADSYPIRRATAPPDQQKQARIFGDLQPHYERKRVYHHVSLRGQPVEAQLVNFSAMSKVDIVDAMSRAFQELRSPALLSAFKENIPTAGTTETLRAYLQRNAVSRFLKAGKGGLQNDPRYAGIAWRMT